MLKWKIGIYLKYLASATVCHRYCVCITSYSYDWKQTHFWKVVRPNYEITFFSVIWWRVARQMVLVYVSTFWDFCLHPNIMGVTGVCSAQRIVTLCSSLKKLWSHAKQNDTKLCICMKTKLQLHTDCFARDVSDTSVITHHSFLWLCVLTRQRRTVTDWTDCSYLTQLYSLFFLDITRSCSDLRTQSELIKWLIPHAVTCWAELRHILMHL